jgi:hypothetical protein
MHSCHFKKKKKRSHSYIQVLFQKYSKYETETETETLVPCTKHLRDFLRECSSLALISIQLLFGEHSEFHASCLMSNKDESDIRVEQPPDIGNR